MPWLNIHEHLEYHARKINLKLAQIDSLIFLNPLNANPAKWSNTLKQFVGNLSTNCLSVFYHFVGLALEGLNIAWIFFSFSFLNF